MKIEKPIFEIWIQEPGINGIYRQIERAGRVCYKSENHRSADSAKPFVERMIRSDHTAMLEHGSVYLTLARDGGREEAVAERYLHNKFSHVNMIDGQACVTTNFRVIVENQWKDDLQYLTEPTDHHERRVTVHFTTQIGTTREFNRHRANSMAEQSTRYCNYAKAKFGNEITVNLPTWVREQIDQQGDAALKFTREDLPELFQKVYDGTATDLENWVFANLSSEQVYMNLTAAGRKPQEARAVLPLDTNTELVHTALVADWKHFFDLRAIGTTGAPHPDAKVLAEPLMEEFKRMGLIE
ncbi:MAG: FAD-dependent thymidylate synthase [Prevotella sp.]|jgi:thymidylate synthase (FAD)